MMPVLTSKLCARPPFGSKKRVLFHLSCFRRRAVSSLRSGVRAAARDEKARGDGQNSVRISVTQNNKPVSALPDSRAEFGRNSHTRIRSREVRFFPSNHPH